MRKHIFLLILLCSLLPAAAVPDSPRSFVDRGRGLFESGRWADARHEFLAARRLLSPEQLSEAEEIDFFLAACAVELGSEEAVKRAFNVLSEGGVVVDPLGSLPWSSCCATVIDRYGVCWWIAI